MSKLYRWGESPPGIPGIPGRIPATVGPPSNLRWTDAADSPFGIAGVDCRSYTQAALACTSDVDEVQTYGRLRDDDGAEHRGQRPAGAEKVACSLRYADWPHRADGIWFRSASMEDKFDVFCFDGVVYVRSSWSGALWLCAGCQLFDRVLRVDAVWAGPVIAGRSPPLCVQQLDYVLKSHALGWWCPHPVPDDVPREPAAMGTYSFVTFGRRAYFASFEDTTGVAASLDDRELA